MAFRKGFFTSTSWTVNEDGFAIGNNAEGSDFLAKFLALAVGNGVPYLPSSNLQCTADSGMNMTVGAGFGVKHDTDGGAYMAWETTDLTISFTSSTSEQTFYISARLDLANNEFTGSHFAKYTTFDADTDLCVAKIVIPANAVAITNAMITDYRGNYTYCGYITDKREELDALIADLQEQIATIIGGGMPDHASTHAAAGDDPIDIDACNGVQYVSQTLTDGEQSQVRTNISAAKAVSGVLDAIEAAVVINAQTDSYTITLADVGKDVWITKSTATTLTIPPQSSVAFVDKSYFFVTRGGAGALTIAGGAGVTVNAAGARLKVAEQYGTVMFRRTAENVWVGTGAMSA